MDTSDQIDSIDEQEELALQAVRDRFHALRLLMRVFRKFFASIGGS